MDYWLKRACNLGASCEQWARAVAANRGLGGLRTLMGLVGLTDRHSFPAAQSGLRAGLGQGNLAFARCQSPAGRQGNPDANHF